MSTTIEIKDSVYAKLLAKSLPRPTHTAAEHARLTKMLLQLDEREDLSPEEETLAEVLTLLIEDYEERFHPLPRVSPNESLKALMEERGLKHMDIWPVLGKQGSCNGSYEWPEDYQQGTSETPGGVGEKSCYLFHNCEDGQLADTWRQTIGEALRSSGV